MSKDTEYSYTDLWQAAMAEWEVQTSGAQFNMIFQKMFISDISGKNPLTLSLGIPNAIWQDEIHKKFHEMVVKTFERLTGKTCSVRYVVAQKPETSTKTVKETKNRQTKKEVASDGVEDLFSSVKPTNTFVNDLKRLRLEPERSLATFAVSTSNEMAYAAAKAVAQRPGSAYNPLFLYGGVGVGKTHLMQGIGQELYRKDQATKIIYCSGEEFTNAIIEAIQKKSTMRFRSKYRTVKLLMIDDIQFIAGKKSVQEEFFHTFNAITSVGGQVIMTSDQPPREIDSLEARLRSRFEGGLIVDIGEPNFELRCAIIMIKAEQHNLEVPSDVVQFIAENEADTRALVGKLITLSAMAMDNGNQITIDLAQKVIKKTELEKQKQPPSPEEVITHVCTHFNQPVPAVKGKGRMAALTTPRFLAMYILREDLNLSLVDIGQMFSGRDHTSVMHAVKKIDTLMTKDPDVPDALSEMRRGLGL